MKLIAALFFALAATSTLDPVVAWVVANKPLIMALIVWPLISAGINRLATMKTPEQWEAWAMAKPGFAFALTLCRGLGIDPKMVAKAFREYALRRAGQVPEGAVAQAKLPAVLQLYLSDPVKLAQLEEMAYKLALAPPTLPKTPAAVVAAPSAPPTVP